MGHELLRPVCGINQVIAPNRRFAVPFSTTAVMEGIIAPPTTICEPRASPGNPNIIHSLRGLGAVSSVALRCAKYCAGVLPRAFLNIVMKAFTDS